MIPDNLIFISAQPFDTYFAWQIEVQIVNFRQFDISAKMHVLVWYKDDSNLDEWYAIQKKYPEVHIYFYKDRGVDLGLYIPQLRPHILQQHFEEFKREFEDKVFFYHDSDIIFRELPDFNILCDGDINWQSDTSSYLDYTYITSKEVQGKVPRNLALNTLARIGGITPEVIKSYDRKTGGAQYILKGIDSSFWADVESMCIAIRKAFFFGIPGSVNATYFQHENAGFQSWTADMWAVNFSLWKRGKVTDIAESLDFSWATDLVEVYNRKNIYHNAGADYSSQPAIFYKGAYINKKPFGEDFSQVSPDFCSIKYTDAIEKVTFLRE